MFCQIIVPRLIGLTVAEASRMHGLGIWTIYRHAKRMGIQMTERKKNLDDSVEAIKKVRSGKNREMIF